MTFRRALRADLLAMACALALLFVMGLDWYSTTAGEEARRIERSTRPQGGLGGEVSRAVDERARAAAEDAERNALQATGTIDRVILGALLATVALALAAGFLRAAGRPPRPPLTVSAVTALCACATALLVLFRMAQQPGDDAAATIGPGPPLAVVVLGILALAGALALRAEEAGLPDAEPDQGGPRHETGVGPDEGDVGRAPVEGGRPQQ